MTVAYCFPDGVSCFGEHGVPDGGLLISHSSWYDPPPDSQLSWREHLQAQCRVAYNNKDYLIPGIPEADTMPQKYDALIAFRERISQWQKVRRSKYNRR